MINIKCNKGITIVSLVITIIILLILTGVTISSIDLSNSNARYNNMVADINLIEDKVFIYFNKYNEIPKTTRLIEIDGTEYYEVDLSKLENLTLNYGKDYGKQEDLNSSSDVYLVNSNLNVYYLKGVARVDKIYHEK